MARGCATSPALPTRWERWSAGSTLANGLELRQVRVPFGVVGMIYEARPNVTADAAGICLKSGNAVLLRGSSSARSSNAAIVAVAARRGGRRRAGRRRRPAGAGRHPRQRQGADAGARPRRRADPARGAGLIRSVVEESTVPVIETGVGNCHVYVDAAADLDQAMAIVLNAKTHRTRVCNAAESLLVHADLAEVFLPAAVAALQEAGVTIHGDAGVGGVRRGGAGDRGGLRDGVPLPRHLRGRRRLGGRGDRAHPALRPATPRRSSPRTSGGPALHRRGRLRRRSLVNASTRFTDGGEFGFGAEIGISTQKLHARGPMGLPEMTSTKYVVTGDGHVR